MSGKGSNLGASVTARLLNRAKKTSDDYQTLLTSYCFERFLYRLGESKLRDRFILKGAMLLRLWSGQPYRATRDLDLLRRGEGSFDAIRDDIRAIAATPVLPDAVEFDGARVRIEAIRAEDEYAGIAPRFQPVAAPRGLVCRSIWDSATRCGPLRGCAPIPRCSIYLRRK